MAEKETLYTCRKMRKQPFPPLFRDDLLIFRGERNLFADYFVPLQRNFNEFLMRRELKQRLSESRAKRVWALPSVSCFDRRSNIVNGAKRMAEMFGHSNNFASLSLSLSQALASNTSIKNRGHPRVNIRLFLQKCKGSQLVFCPRLNVKTNIETQ